MSDKKNDIRFFSILHLVCCGLDVQTLVSAIAENAGFEAMDYATLRGV